MKKLHHKLAVLCLLTGMGLSATAIAQNTPKANPGARAAQSAQFEEMRNTYHAQRFAALKQALNLNAAQEAAWNDFNAAMQPMPFMPGRGPMQAGGPGSNPEFNNMTTPERIKARQEWQAQMQEFRLQREAAIMTYYNQLDSTQQATFDQTFYVGQGEPGARGGYGQKGGRFKGQRGPGAGGGGGYCFQ